MERLQSTCNPERMNKKPDKRTINLFLTIIQIKDQIPLLQTCFSNSVNRMNLALPN